MFYGRRIKMLTQVLHDRSAVGIAGACAARCEAMKRTAEPRKARRQQRCRTARALHLDIYKNVKKVYTD